MQDDMTWSASEKATQSLDSVAVETPANGLPDVENVTAVGYVTDFISGKLVRATPEETEAVQVFARRLVEDFDYPKDVIQTRPQFRVRMRPSQENRGRGYPVDIAVFRRPAKLEDDLFIIVECKKPERTDGEKQLKLYMSMSAATVGVWFNGRDHLYLHKRLLADGSVDWQYLPTLPKFGQTIADIGSLHRDQRGRFATWELG
jgi:type I restriction enzyme M protein